MSTTKTWLAMTWFVRVLYFKNKAVIVKMFLLSAYNPLNRSDRSQHCFLNNGIINLRAISLRNKSSTALEVFINQKDVPSLIKQGWRLRESIKKCMVVHYRYMAVHPCSHGMPDHSCVSELQLPRVTKQTWHPPSMTAGGIQRSHNALNAAQINARGHLCLCNV